MSRLKLFICKEDGVLQEIETINPNDYYGNTEGMVCVLAYNSRHALELVKKEREKREVELK